MEEDLYREYDFEINADEPLFVISVVSELVSMPVWTLRKLDELGIVPAKRLGKKTRCYSKKQIGKLSYIWHLMTEKGVNIQGIQVIMSLNRNNEDLIV